MQFSFLLVSTIIARDYTEFFYNSQSIYGGTGQIVLPSTRVISKDKYVVSIHGFDINVVFGIYKRWESGIFFNLRALSTISTKNIKEKIRNIFIHSKYQIFTEHEFPLELSCGLHGLGPNIYIVAGKKIHSLNSYIGVTFSQNERIFIKPFFSLHVVRGMSMFIFDYDTNDESLYLGWKFLLSPNIKFSINFMKINQIKDIDQIKNVFFDNFVFGLLYSN